MVFILAWFVKEGSLEFESKLLNELDLFIVNIFIVENRQLLHPCLHLCTEPRVLLQQFCPAVGVLGCVDFSNKIVELGDPVSDLV